MRNVLYQCLFSLIFRHLVYRLEKALSSVPRQDFFCVDDFDFCTDFSVTFKSEGEYTTKCLNGVLNLDQEPVSLVVPYMIRTGFQSAMKEASRAKIVKELISKSKGQPIFDKHEFEEKLRDFKSNHKDNNIFVVSRFKKQFLYRFFCEATEEQLQRTPGAKKTNDGGPYQPEQFQVLMVASKLLKSVFAEECFHEKLMSDMLKKKRITEKFSQGISKKLFRSFITLRPR